MKNIPLLFTLLFIIGTVNTFAQTSCCAKPGSTEAFASLSHDKQFVALHLEPAPFILGKPAGKEITFKTPDGKEGYAYEIKAEKPTGKVVIVIHEWWGLNDYIKKESEKIYNGFGDATVIAIDMYDKKVADNRDSAGKYMQSVTSERGEAIVKGLITYIGPKASIATIGWCFGGGWSMQASLLAGKQAKACVMYYGMPEEKTEKIKNLNAPVLFVFAEKDQWINKDVLAKFESNMKVTKKSLEVKKYDADHAFANPSNPKYNKDFAADAFKIAMSFMKTNLK